MYNGSLKNDFGEKPSNHFQVDKQGNQNLNRSHNWIIYEVNISGFNRGRVKRTCSFFFLFRSSNKYNMSYLKQNSFFLWVQIDQKRRCQPMRYTCIINLMLDKSYIRLKLYRLRKLFTKLVKLGSLAIESKIRMHSIRAWLSERCCRPSIKFKQFRIEYKCFLLSRVVKCSKLSWISLKIKR